MLDRWGILTAYRRRFGMNNPAYEQIQARKVKAGCACCSMRSA